MVKPKSDYSIQTVSNALRLLEAFEEHDELGVSELARQLDLHKNNVFRLLATLEQSGYIQQSARSERYRLDVRCLALGRSYIRSHELLRCARPVLERLCKQVGESAHLGVLDGFAVTHLDGEQPNALVLGALRLGSRLPAYCTALGKVLLACGGPETLESFDRSLSGGASLEARSDATLVDRDKLIEHLRSVSVQGFALDLDECAEGLRCAAAPVFGQGQQLRAAISISGPSFRLDADSLHREIVPAVMEAADSLSATLGASA